MTRTDWFGNLPRRWVATRLKNIIESSQTGVWGNDPRGDTDDILCVRVADFDRPRAAVGSVETVRSVPAKDREGRLLKPGDILLEKSGGTDLNPVGFSVMFSGDYPAVSSNFIARVRVRAGQSSRFWLYALAASYATKRTERAVRRTTGIQNLDQSAFLNEQFPVPPADEQRVIADFLDRETARIDSLVEEQQRLIDLLRERRDAVSDQLVGSHTLLHPLKRLVNDVTVGIVVNPAAWYADDGVPALRGLNVRPGRIITSELVYLTPEGDAQHAKSRLHSGDVVVVRTGQAGAAAVVPPELDGVNAIDLLIVRPGFGVNPDFLAAYLNAPSTRSIIAEGSVGAIQGHFNVGSLRELPFPDLPADDQRRRGEKWLEQAEAIDTLIAETERFIELARERRSALITAAVTGQIDVRAEAS